VSDKIWIAVADAIKKLPHPPSRHSSSVHTFHDLISIFRETEAEDNTITEKHSLYNRKRVTQRQKHLSAPVLYLGVCGIHLHGKEDGAGRGGLRVDLCLSNRMQERGTEKRNKSCPPYLMER
jgi:hypothetical protein